MKKMFSFKKIKKLNFVFLFLILLNISSAILVQDTRVQKIEQPGAIYFAKWINLSNYTLNDFVYVSNYYDLLSNQINSEVIDENGQKAIIRDPRFAVFYYFDTNNGLISYNPTILTNNKEILDFLFYYNHFNDNYKPYIFTEVGVPAVIFSYLKSSNELSSYPEDFYYSTYNSKLIVLFNNVNNNPIELPNLINFLSDKNLSFNFSKIENFNGSNLLKLYHTDRFTWAFLGKTINITYYNSTNKTPASILYTGILFPYGAYYLWFDNVKLLNETELSDTWKTYLENYFINPSLKLAQAIKAYYLSDSSINKLQTQDEFNNYFSYLPAKLDELKKATCVYYYKDNNYKENVYTGKIVENGTFFVSPSDYYYLNGSKLVKFKEDKVYYCLNGQWVTLDNSYCEKLADKYNVYKEEGIYYNGTNCLIDEKEENPIWYRELKGNTTIENKNILKSEKAYLSNLDCVDENGNIIKNGQITNNDLMCSAGVLTPVLSDINKFYIKDFPTSINLSFQLQNFANEKIKLISQEVKGIPSTWKYKFVWENNNITFNPGEKFKTKLILYNYEDNGSIKNLNISLLFQLDDNRTYLTIPFNIPLRIQFSKEYLVKSEVLNPIVYDSTKGETNNITIRFIYDSFGALKNIPYCTYGQNGFEPVGSNLTCKYFTITYQLPNDCYPVAFNLNQFELNGYLNYPTIKFYCKKEITQDDTIKVCSKTMIVQNNNGNLETIDLCNGNCNNSAHCEQIPLYSTSYKKDFSLSSNYEKNIDSYYFDVLVQNTGNTELKGITIQLTDVYNNCNVECLEEGCSKNNNIITYYNANATIPVGATYNKIFKLYPTGICQLQVKVIVDDPIEKNMTVIINPYTEKDVINYVKKDNPSLYPFLIIIVSIFLIIFGIYKIKNEFE